MQAASDIFLGWLRLEGLDGRPRDYYVRQLHDWKGGAQVETLRVPGATLYARLCGATLARAHARRGDRIAIASYLGRRRRLRPGHRRLLRRLRRAERAGLRGLRRRREDGTAESARRRGRVLTLAGSSPPCRAARPGGAGAASAGRAVTSRNGRRRARPCPRGRRSWRAARCGRRASPGRWRGPRRRTARRAPVAATTTASVDVPLAGWPSAVRTSHSRRTMVFASVAVMTAFTIAAGTSVASTRMTMLIVAGGAGAGALTPAEVVLLRPIDTAAATVTPSWVAAATRACSVSAAVISPTNGSAMPQRAAKAARTSSGRTPGAMSLHAHVDDVARLGEAAADDGRAQHGERPLADEAHGGGVDRDVTPRIGVERVSVTRRPSC